MTHSLIYSQKSGIARKNERLKGRVQPKKTFVYCVKTVARLGTTHPDWVNWGWLVGCMLHTAM